MKKICLLLLFFVSGYSSIGQTMVSELTEEETKLQQEATKMGQLFISRNFSDYLKFVHPKIIQLVGGEKAMTEVLEKSISKLAEQGFSFKNISMGTPSKILTAGNEKQAVIPQILEMKNQTGTLVATSYLLAISSDNGNTWQFIDTGGKTLEEMKKVFPSLNSNLLIPPRKQPVFNRD